MAATSGAAVRTARRPGLSQRIAPDNLLGWLLIGLLCLLVGLPLVFVLAQGIAPGIGLVPGWRFAPEVLGELFTRPLWQRSIVNSLTLAFGAMFLGGALGSLLAMLRHSLGFRGAGLLDAAAWILLVSPSFILAQGWVLLAAPRGVAAAVAGIDLSNLVFAPGGLIVIMSLTKFPLAYLATSAALAWDNDSLRDAAALSGAAPRTIFRTVRFPLILPAILSGAILVFVDVLGDFGLPAALSASYNFPTLPYSIYASVRQSPVSFERGGVLSLYLVVIIALALAVYLRLLRRSSYDFVTGAAVRVQAPPARHPWVWTGVTALVLCATLVLPLGTSLIVSLSQTTHGGLALANLTFDHYAAIFAPGSRMFTGALNSLWVALAAAVLTTVLAFLSCAVLTFTKFRARALIDLFATVSLAVPGIVLAIGYIFVWNQPVLAHFGLALYGKPPLLVLAGVAAALPVAVRLQLGAFAQIPANLLGAAAIGGVGFAVRLRTILLPLVAPAVVSAFAAVLASSIFDLAATSMLAPPNFVTLPVEILAEYDRGNYGYATAGAICSAAIVVLLAAASVAIGRRMIRSSPSRKDTP